MHSTQYINQFNTANKHASQMSMGGSGKTKGFKMNRFASLKQNSDQRKKQQMTLHQPHFHQQQTQQQHSVKMWLFKGFNTVGGLEQYHIYVFNF